jgi:lipoyl(octanoyl) transferase
VAVLADYSIEGAPRPDAPGVYVNGAKVAALGLRVRRGCSYHGLALNVNMDLEPFSRINPCGLLGMEVTQISDLGGPTQIGVVQNLLLDKLSDVYGISLSRLDR